MTQIDFYILKGDSHGSRQAFACRLAEKAYAQGHRLYIHLENEDQLRDMDDLLWTFRQGSFLPHARYPDDTGSAPILLGHGEPPADTELLLNLGREAPAFYPRFKRILEVVDSDVQQIADGRARFRYYRQQGEAPDTHNLE